MEFTGKSTGQIYSQPRLLAKEKIKRKTSMTITQKKIRVNFMQSKKNNSRKTAAHRQIKKFLIDSNNNKDKDDIEFLLKRL